MITPKFSVTQDYEYIHIVIHAPHVKTQQVDILAEQDEFRFVVAPYFLRLKLPGNIIEDDRSSAKYDLSTGDFKIVLPKETPGQFFEDLDLLSKLLARKSDSASNASKGPGKSLIEVLSSTSTELPPSELLEDEELDWEIPQELPTETLNFGKVGYGFNGAYSSYFDHIQEMPNEINEIPNPETTPVLERRKIRLALEDEKFDEDYYLGDLSAENEEEFQSIFKFKPKWAKVLREVQKQKKCPANTLQVSDCAPRKIIEEVTPHVALNLTEQKPASSKMLVQDMSNDSTLPDSKTSTSTIEEKMDSLSMDCVVSKKLDSQQSMHTLLEFTEKEKAVMVSLFRKEYILNKEESRPIYLGLVDLILGYSYEYRVTQGEFSVESSWTIGKLCSSMACLEVFSTLSEVLIAHRRRILSYPLYRHFELGKKVVHDTAIIFKLGRRALLKVLLQLKDLFDHHDVHYRYSKILLDDYCVWIQTWARDATLSCLGNQINDTPILPKDLGWDLDELNALVEQVQTE